jgi:hypothetical protein
MFQQGRTRGPLISTTQDREPAEERTMQDVVWIVVTIAFFAASIAYVRFCDRMK